MKRQSAENSSDLPWAFFIPCLLVTLLVVVSVVHYFVKMPDLSQLSSIFRPFAVAEANPEPQKLFGYTVALAVIPIFYFFSFLWVKKNRMKLKFHSKLTQIQIYLGQLVFFYLVVFSWFFQDHYIRSYFHFDHSVGAFLLCLGIAYGTRKYHRSISNWFSKSQNVYFLVGFLTALRLLSCVFTDSNIRLVSSYILYHLDFTMDEFAAVLNGRTPLVDFFPQYQNVLSYLLLPFFKFWGMTIGTFSFAMVTLSWVSLILVFATWVQVTQSGIAAFILYFCFLGVTFFRLRYEGWLTVSPFNYYAVGPIRYFGPFVLLWILQKTLRNRTNFMIWVTSFVGGLIVLNNVDFGFPALAGSILALIFSKPFQDWKNWKTCVRFLAVLALGIFTSIGLFCLLTFAHSGQFPDFQKMGEFRKIYAIYGISNYPAAPISFAWIVFLTFQASLIFSLYRWIFSNLNSPNLRLRNGVLAYSGLFGLGALAYFVHRSHPDVLCAIFSAWGLSLLLLCWEGYLFWRANKNQKLPPGKIIPLLLLCLGFFVALARGFLIGSSLDQIERIKAIESSYEFQKNNNIEVILKYTVPGEKVMVIYPLAHQLAQLAKVDNLFPYAHHTSPTLIVQLDEMMRRIRAHSVKAVFGIIDRDLRIRIEQEGFQSKDSQGDFEVWIK